MPGGALAATTGRTLSVWEPLVTAAELQCSPPSGVLQRSISKTPLTGRER